jgi:hypothetical protein
MKTYIAIAIALLLGAIACFISDIVWFKFMLWLTTDNKPKVERITVTI